MQIPLQGGQFYNELHNELSNWTLTKWKCRSLKGWQSLRSTDRSETTITHRNPRTPEYRRRKSYHRIPKRILHSGFALHHTGCHVCKWKFRPMHLGWVLLCKRSFWKYQSPLPIPARIHIRRRWDLWIDCRWLSLNPNSFKGTARLRPLH
jgi:hypothetical protein